MKYYLKCTYSKGMLPGERVVSFPVANPAIDPMMRGDYGKSFCWFVNEKELTILDGTNALLHISAYSKRENNALVSFCISGSHADLKYYTSAENSVACVVPLEDIVERK